MQHKQRMIETAEMFLDRTTFVKHSQQATYLPVLHHIVTSTDRTRLGHLALATVFVTTQNITRVCMKSNTGINIFTIIVAVLLC